MPWPSVRPSRPEDLPAIGRIYAHHVLHGLGSFEETPPDAAELARRRDEVLRHGLPWLAAELDDGTLAGYAYAAPYRTRPAYRFTVEDSVYVSPDHLGRGAGAALLARLIELCEAAGRRQMVAVIGDSANAASVRLHESLGFRRTGLLASVGLKHGRWVDTILMQRPLGAGDGAPPASSPDRA